MNKQLRLPNKYVKNLRVKAYNYANKGRVLSRLTDALHRKYTLSFHYVGVLGKGDY
ncbi:MAG: hypothetical protein NTW85_04490 [Methylococcales bacterium]|nr:hypothetical protein [Methylococcales bacterium]